MKVENHAVIEALFSVLRSKGYDGASLGELSEASGLQKASLYHRFPGGKDEMVRVVLAFVHNFIEVRIYRVLTDSSVSPKARLSRVLMYLDSLYLRGEASCIFRALAIDSGMELFGHEIRKSMRRWTLAFQKLGESFGQKKKEAAANAEQALILIQGGLIVSKGLSNKSTFRRSLQMIERLYI